MKDDLRPVGRENCDRPIYKNNDSFIMELFFATETVLGNFQTFFLFLNNSLTKLSF